MVNRLYIGNVTMILKLIIYSMAIVKLNDSSTGIAIFGSLVALGFAEIGIAISVIIFCSTYGRSCCCYGEARGTR